MNIQEQFNTLSPWERSQFIDENMGELLGLISEKEPERVLGCFEGEDILEVLQEDLNVSAEELLDAIGDIDTVRDMIEGWDDEEPFDEEEYYS